MMIIITDPQGGSSLLNYIGQKITLFTIQIIIRVMYGKVDERLTDLKLQ